MRAGGHFNELHDRRRIEKVHTNNRTVQTLRHLSQGKRGCVGSENRILFTDRLKLAEQLLFQIHLFKRSLDNEIAVGNLVVESCCDLCKNLVHLGLLHAALGDLLGQGFLNLLFTARGKFLGDVAQDDLVAVRYGECLRNTGTHGAGADDSNFHSYVTSIYF